jgi:protein SCO1
MTFKQRIYSRPGGDWVLKDSEGKVFGSHHLKGQYYLLFFGHTMSEDVSPLTVYKMTKAVKRLSKSKESQFIKCVCVFVSVKPEQDTGIKLKEFGELFDPEGKLILLREEDSKSKNLVEMLRKFKVPVGLSEEEKRNYEEFF